MNSYRFAFYPPPGGVGGGGLYPSQSSQAIPGTVAISAHLGPPLPMPAPLSLGLLSPSAVSPFIATSLAQSRSTVDMSGGGLLRSHPLAGPFFGLPSPGNWPPNRPPTSLATETYLSTNKIRPHNNGVPSFNGANDTALARCSAQPPTRLSSAKSLSFNGSSTSKSAHTSMPHPHSNMQRNGQVSFETSSASDPLNLSMSGSKNTHSPANSGPKLWRPQPISITSPKHNDSRLVVNRPVSSHSANRPSSINSSPQGPNQVISSATQSLPLSLSLGTIFSSPPTATLESAYMEYVRHLAHQFNSAQQQQSIQIANGLVAQSINSQQNSNPVHSAPMNFRSERMSAPSVLVPPSTSSSTKSSQQSSIPISVSNMNNLSNQLWRPPIGTSSTSAPGHHADPFIASTRNSNKPNSIHKNLSKSSASSSQHISHKPLSLTASLPNSGLAVADQSTSLSAPLQMTSASTASSRIAPNQSHVKLVSLLDLKEKRLKDKLSQQISHDELQGGPTGNDAALNCMSSDDHKSNRKRRVSSPTSSEEELSKLSEPKNKSRRLDAADPNSLPHQTDDKENMQANRKTSSLHEFDEMEIDPNEEMRDGEEVDSDLDLDLEDQIEYFRKSGRFQPLSSQVSRDPLEVSSESNREKDGFLSIFGLVSQIRRNTMELEAAQRRMRRAGELAAEKDFVPHPNRYPVSKLIPSTASSSSSSSTSGAEKPSGKITRGSLSAASAASISTSSDMLVTEYVSSIPLSSESSVRHCSRIRERSLLISLGAGLRELDSGCKPSDIPPQEVCPVRGRVVKSKEKVSAGNLAAATSEKVFYLQSLGLYKVQSARRQLEVELNWEGVLRDKSRRVDRQASVTPLLNNLSGDASRRWKNHLSLLANPIVRNQSLNGPRPVSREFVQEFHESVLVATQLKKKCTAKPDVERHEPLIQSSEANQQVEQVIRVDTDLANGTQIGGSFSLSTSHVPSLAWPGIEAIMESYERHCHDTNEERDFLSSRKEVLQRNISSSERQLDGCNEKLARLTAQKRQVTERAEALRKTIQRLESMSSHLSAITAPANK